MIINSFPFFADSAAKEPELGSITIEASYKMSRGFAFVTQYDPETKTYTAERREFVVTSPYAPVSFENVPVGSIVYLAASCDSSVYGEKVTVSGMSNYGFTFKGPLIYAKDGDVNTSASKGTSYFSFAGILSESAGSIYFN